MKYGADWPVPRSVGPLFAHSPRLSSQAYLDVTTMVDEQMDALLPAAGSDSDECGRSSVGVHGCG